MISDKEFMQAAALLKRTSDADAWANFVGAVEAYTFTKIGEVTDAAIESVVVYQGYARAWKKLLQMVQECERYDNKGGKL